MITPTQWAPVAFDDEHLPKTPINLTLSPLEGGGWTNGVLTIVDDPHPTVSIVAYRRVRAGDNVVHEALVSAPLTKRDAEATLRIVAKLAGLATVRAPR